MKSQWYESKQKAVNLRKLGLSIRKIESSLGIPRSTLSGWFKNIELTESQKDSLRKGKLASLAGARKLAMNWHNTQKKKRVEKARFEAENSLNFINWQAKPVVDLALAMLYLGEGYKAAPTLALGNSNPIVLKFFIQALSVNYQVEKNDFKCELHIRSDQDPVSIVGFWSTELGLPIQSFTKVSVAKRTINSQSHPDYKGVCVVRYGNTAVQRKLSFLSKIFCEKVVEDCHEGV